MAGVAMIAVSVLVRSVLLTKSWNEPCTINNDSNKVVELDLEKFFDRVNHDKLISVLCERVTDRILLELILQYLQQV